MTRSTRSANVVICAATLAIVAALAACGATTDSRAETPTPTSSTNALPATFPDLMSMTPVDVAQFQQSYPYFTGVQFSTPDGQQCYSNDMNSRNDPAIRTLTCEGPRPDKGPGSWEIDVATNTPATSEPAAPSLNPNYQPPENERPKPLPPQHSIEYKGIRCGVDDKGTTGCVAGDHGFVLTPTSTTLF
ncbi:hypothetical protein [Mycobacterium kyogaense]|uniref:hypothetical protein n=1 Tax=Mycobacterium kyogaense TaxID=2212479 RepID=UPI0013C5264F|nr:hypothetical protein [Mycobacterium kyogaense]